MKTRTAGRLLGAAALVLALSACEGTITVQPQESPSSSPAASGTTSAPADSTPAADPGPQDSAPSPAQAQPPVEEPADAPAAGQPAPGPVGQPAPGPVDQPVFGPGASSVDYVPKFIGEDAYLNTVDGSHAVTFTLNDVVSNVLCDYPTAPAAEHGRLIRLDIDLHTAGSATMEQVLGANSFGFSGPQWNFVDANGISTNSINTFSAYSCLDPAGTFPYGVGPNEHVTGYIVLDIPSTSGTLRYMDPTIGQGWEWQIG